MVSKWPGKCRVDNGLGWGAAGRSGEADLGLGLGKTDGSDLGFDLAVTLSARGGVKQNQGGGNALIL